MSKLAAIILMSGEGERFGLEVPKQFQRLSGKPLYQHTLETFVSSELFKEIILVVHPDWIEKVEAGPAKIVSGGKTRQESSYLGVMATSDQIDAVVIHDAVRPLVSQEILKANAEALNRFDAVDTCIPSPDTIVHSKNSQTISQIPTRSEYQRGQTPQSFSKKLYFQAHREAHTAGIKNASDDCQLVLRLNEEIAIVPGAEENLKITTPLDLYIAEQLMRQRLPTFSGEEQSLAGKRYVVAGGNGGIGRAICTKLEALGCTAIPLSRTTTPFSADLSKHEECQKALAKIGKIDGLIHAAGILHVKPFLELSFDEMEALINTNFKSLIYCARFAQICKGGHFLPIGSSSYYRGRKGYGLYSAAKAAAVNFTQSFAEERPDLNVNICLPSRTDTKLRRKNFPYENKDELLQPESVAREVIKILQKKSSMGTWSLTRF